MTSHTDWKFTPGIGPNSFSTDIEKDVKYYNPNKKRRYENFVKVCIILTVVGMLLPGIPFAAKATDSVLMPICILGSLINWVISLA